MRVLVLTKPFGAIEAAELADTLAAVGADGADLVVRDGQTVTPADPSKIATVLKELERRDLSLGVVTTDFVDGGPVAERVIAAAAESGAPLVRAGFFRYDPSRGYRACLEESRRGLANLADLADRHGVRLALQLHHGTIHPSGALALAMARDDVHFYADPGNQAKEGSEDWRLTLDLLGDRLACMGVKNAAWRESAVEWQPLADGGVVPWPEIVKGLGAFDGPLSVHVHFPAEDPRAVVRRDVDYLRGLLA